MIFEVIEENFMIEQYELVLINNFPLMDFKKSFFMQDGAGMHTSDDVLDLINSLWKDRWIGLTSERLQFPSYSMDLTPLDFGFLPHVKRLVSICYPETTQELKDSIINVLSNMNNETITRMCQGVMERCSKCIMKNGDRFEGEL